MKPLEKIEKIVKKFSVDTNAEKNELVLNELLEAQAKSKKTKSALNEPNIWRIIVKSRIIKIAAAAAVLVVAVFILHNGKVDMASTVYAQMRDNMQKMPWLHIIVNANLEGKDAQMEQWYSDEFQVIAIKKPDGELEFSDYKKGIRYEYDPNAQFINISFINQNDYSKRAIPLQNGIDSMLSMLNQQEATITHSLGQFEGKDIEIYEVRYQMKKMVVEGRIYVNPENRLPIYCKYRVTDGDGNRSNAQMRYEFPGSGPKNIYDIGAPISAKAPPQDLQEVLEAYISHRKNIPQRYIAIVTEDQWYNKIRFLDVIYKDGQTQRKEKRSTDEFKQQWMEYSGQTDVPFADLLELAQKGGNEYNTISLCVDGKSYWAYRSKNQPWKISEQPSSGPNRLANDDLAGLGWPIYSNMQNEGVIIENDYSLEHNLICIELTEQARVTQQSVHTPSKRLCYLNPKRDYICERIEYYSIQNASWQKDRSWLEGVDPDELHRDTRNITEVTEYQQTEGGKWYPWKIEFIISSYDSDINAFDPYTLHNLKTVYLNTDPNFPEGIFDPNNLPKEGD